MASRKGKKSAAKTLRKAAKMELQRPLMYPKIPVKPTPE